MLILFGKIDLIQEEYVVSTMPVTVSFGLKTISRTATTIAALFLFLSSLALGQTPPQIGAAASLYGGSPDATFYAGARIGQGPYLNAVERTSDFQLQIQVG
jgi:hypothetical protein